MKNILRTLVFLALLIAVIASLSLLLERKGSREKIQPFLDRAGQIDVLFLGDSHMYGGIYPMELWQEYGIASYNLASYNNTIPVSYWALRNALEVCRPEVVVMDIDLIWEQIKPSHMSGDMHTALDGFPLSRTKVQAIWDLMDDPLLTDDAGNRFADLRWEFLFPFMKYHARWYDVSAQDLHPQYNQELGAEMNIAVAEPEDYEILYSAVDEEGYGFEYLRRLIEDCQREGIEVLLVNLPYPCIEEQHYANAVVYLAEEYGLEYLDFVYMDQIVDYSTDCYDPGSHLNPSGARKVTDFVGQFLRETYGVQDHRGAAEYASWDADYAAYHAIKLEKLREQKEMDELYSFLMLLSDPAWSVCLTLPADSALYADETGLQLLQNIGRRHLMMEDTDEAVWSDGLLPLEALADAVGSPYLAVIDRAMGEIHECIVNEPAQVQASFGTVTYEGDETGAVITQGDAQIAAYQHADADVHVAVIDAETGEVVLACSLNLPEAS